MTRTDLIAYFVETLHGLDPALQSRPHITALAEGLEGILADLGGYDPEAEGDAKVPTEAEVKALAAKARELVALVERGGE